MDNENYAITMSGDLAKKIIYLRAFNKTYPMLGNKGYFTSLERLLEQNIVKQLSVDEGHFTPEEK